MNVKLHNKRIVGKATELDGQYPTGYLHVTSRAGTVTEVTTGNAAKLLIEDTHYISSEQELAEFQRHNDAVREQLQRGELALNKPTLGITNE